MDIDRAILNLPPPSRGGEYDFDLLIGALRVDGPRVVERRILAALASGNARIFWSTVYFVAATLAHFPEVPIPARHRDVRSLIATMTQAYGQVWLRPKLTIVDTAEVASALCCTARHARRIAIKLAASGRARIGPDGQWWIDGEAIEDLRHGDRNREEGTERR